MGLSPFGHQVTLGLEDMEGHAYQDTWYTFAVAASNSFQSEQNVQNVLYLYCLSLFVCAFIKIKRDVLSMMRMSSILYTKKNEII